MKIQHFLIFTVFLLCSCDNAYDITRVTMQDGNTLTIFSSKKYYSNEEEFVHNVTFTFPRLYEYSEIEEIDYQEDTDGVVTGYSQSFIGYWEIAKFGEWIRAYGLVPNKTYYVATKVYVKYLSMPPSGLRIIPKKGGALMGYCPGVEPRTFWVNNISEAQVSVLFTGFRYIGYDSEGNDIKREMPSLIDDNNKLTWKFLIRDDGWD